MFGRLFIPLALLGILIVAIIYWKREAPADRESLESPSAPYTARSKPQPAQADTTQPDLEADTLEQASSTVAERLKAENAQLRKQNKTMGAQLAKTQSQLKRLQSAQVARQDILSQPGTQQLLSTVDLDVTRQDNHLLIYDKQGQELFEFDLKNKRLSYEGGMNLSPLNTVVFDVPESIRELKSLEAKDRATLTFENTREDDVHIFWLDYKGQPKHYRTLSPGKTHTQETFMTHPWIFTDSEGNIHSQAEPIHIDQHESIVIPE